MPDHRHGDPTPRSSSNHDRPCRVGSASPHTWTHDQLPLRECAVVATVLSS